MALSISDVKGLYPALVTPFDQHGDLDETALRRLTKRMVSQGASGLVPIGGTGEYPALSRSERQRVVEVCVEESNSVPVVPGVLSTGLADSIETTNDFAKVGAQGVMAVTPYYSPGSQQGMIEYFKRLRDATDLPLMLYEIPRRTTIALKAETVATLAEEGTVIGIKYSSYDMAEFLRVIEFAGDKLGVMSGEEPLFSAHVAAGAVGGVLASANIYPRFWLKVYELASQNRLPEALAMQKQIDELLGAVYCETNPIPLKRAMALCGENVGGVRLPLLPASEEVAQRLQSAMKTFHLQSGFEPDGISDE